MKTFRLFGIIMMLVMGMSLTSNSCDGDDEDEPEPTTTESLTGTWIGYAGDERLKYYFDSDKSGYFQEKNNDKEYFTKYKISDGELLIRWEGDDDYDFEGYIKDITKNSFKLRYDIDEEWITLEKQ